MNPTDVAFLKGVVVFVLAAGVVLRGFKLWIGAREQWLDGSARETIAQLEESHAQREAELQAELSELQAQVGELYDRLDFAERKLASERDASRIEPRHLTPV